MTDRSTQETPTQVLWTPETDQIEFMLAEAELVLLMADIRRSKSKNTTAWRVIV